MSPIAIEVARTQILDSAQTQRARYLRRQQFEFGCGVGNASLEANKLAVLETARRGAIYRLDDTIDMELSQDSAAHAVTCSGALDVTGKDTIAHKALTLA
jgi:hypothetical protein